MGKHRDASNKALNGVSIGRNQAGAFLKAGLLIIGILVALGFFFTERNTRTRLIKGYNAELSAIVTAVRAAYPEVTEEELIHILQDKKSAAFREDAAADEAVGALEKERDLFSRFGYSEGMSYSARFDAIWSRHGLTLALILLFATGGILTLFCGYRAHLRGQLQDLLEDVKSIEKGRYQLKPEQEDETLISRLHSETYRVMTLLRESEAQSRAAQEHLSDALADISHQLRTPLTGARILLDNLCEDPDMPVEVRMDFLRTMDRQLAQISSLVVTLLHLSKLESGTMQMHQSPVRMADLLENVKSRLDVLLEVRQVSLTMEGDLAEKLMLDERWETQALMNLVKNAAEHSPEGSSIHIEGNRYGLFYVLKIADEGEGISRADLPHIFERFYKAKNSAPESIGIGLAFAKAIVEADGGSITADSEDGHGTVMKIRYRMEA